MCALIWCLIYLAFSVAFPSENAPTGIHTAMFMPALRSQASPAQQEYWLSKAQRYDIIGTYAQSELGHGNE